MPGFTKILYAHLLSRIHATCPKHLIILDLIIQIIFGDKYRSLSFSLYSFLQSPVILSLRPKYSPQHPMLKHPQPAFLPHFERPSFTPIQNNREHHISVYLNAYLFGYQTGRQMNLHQMIASIP